MAANTTLAWPFSQLLPSAPPWLWMGDTYWLRVSSIDHKPILPGKFNSLTAFFCHCFSNKLSHSFVVSIFEADCICEREGFFSFLFDGSCWNAESAMQLLVQSDYSLGGCA